MQPGPVDTVGDDIGDKCVDKHVEADADEPPLTLPEWNQACGL